MSKNRNISVPNKFQKHISNIDNWLIMNTFVSDEPIRPYIGLRDIVKNIP
ncbi:hypothetical protein NRIC0776_00330 [Apilactobacillus kunkeei]